tara:strand:+ start:16750 stop:17460 length:711 start_codon:yes stop_codon:yes gene_type:complete
VRVESDQFLIGRHKDADLTLESRTISRRHCAIVQQDDIVAIVDLGGRNPTILNGELLAKGKPRRLRDQDKIQIGRMKFRVVLQPKAAEAARADSTESHLLSPAGAGSGESPIDSLLQELDDIAAKFQVTNHFVKPPVTLQKASYEDPKTGNPTQCDSGNNEDDESETSMTTVALPGGESEATHVAGSGTRDTDDETQAPGDAAKVPKKLPEHLRAKGPVDSQEAAQIALRNMFNRR